MSNSEEWKFKIGDKVVRVEGGVKKSLLVIATQF